MVRYVADLYVSGPKQVLGGARDEVLVGFREICELV